MLYIAICDDLTEDRIRLRGQVEYYFEKLESRVRVTTFSSGDELVAAIEAHEKYHVIFMDIYMEGISGVEASRRIRRIDGGCAIIFTTTSPDHAMAGYEVRASDYLLKPFHQEDVDKALSWALENLPKDMQTLEVISDRVHMELDITKIRYVEIFGRESSIHMSDGEVIVTNQSLRSLEEYLGTSFIRCHKSYLVNPAYIQRLAKGAAILQGEEEIPVGTEMEARCRELFYEWTFKRTWERL